MARRKPEPVWLENRITGERIEVPADSQEIARSRYRRADGPLTTCPECGSEQEAPVEAPSGPVEAPEAEPEA